MHKVLLPLALVVIVRRPVIGPVDYLPVALFAIVAEVTRVESTISCEAAVAIELVVLKVAFVVQENYLLTKVLEVHKQFACSSFWLLTKHVLMKGALILVAESILANVGLSP